MSHGRGKKVEGRKGEKKVNAAGGVADSFWCFEKISGEGKRRRARLLIDL